MAIANTTFVKLADIIATELRRRKSRVPARNAIAQLIDSTYYASLKTEETQPIRFNVVYLDPMNPYKNRPEKVRKGYWSYVPLSHPVQFSPAEIAKLANASDPRSSSFVVFPHDHRKLCVWGLIDQQHQYHEFINHDRESGWLPPGLFRVNIVDVGYLSVEVGGEKIAELRMNTINRKTFDVFQNGPILQALWPGISTHIATVSKTLPHNTSWEYGDYAPDIVHDWVTALRRLLLRIQGYRHGGAILITPDTSYTGLNLKYGLNYDRLRLALQTRAQIAIEKDRAEAEILDSYIEKGKDQIPTDLYFAGLIAEGNASDIRSELDGTLWFISLLSRVDGLVLMNSTLDVKGFGVEITFDQIPASVSIARSLKASPSQLHKVDYNHYGTRHRSMMRYCGQIPGSVGFVVSHDGDIRIISKVRNDVVIWENIKLQLPDFVHIIPR